MSEGAWLLVIVGALGVLAKNQLIVGACATLLILKLGRLDGVFPWFNQYGIAVGLYLLMVALLAPVAGDEISIVRFTRELLSPVGLFAVFAAALGAWIARFGVTILDHHPQVLVGLVVGSVVGTVALGGVPTGPLFAAGLTALFANWLLKG